MPRAIIGSIIIVTAIYILLQIAFIGVIPEDQLVHGWSGVVLHGASGPFAAFAMILGLSWLAVILYVDATTSPLGTALVFTAGTSRLNVAMSRNRNIPAFIGKVNAKGTSSRCAAVESCGRHGALGAIAGMGRTRWDRVLRNGPHRWHWRAVVDCLKAIAPGDKEILPTSCRSLHRIFGIHKLGDGRVLVRMESEPYGCRCVGCGASAAGIDGSFRAKEPSRDLHLLPRNVAVSISGEGSSC